jgi:hypothetical protein
MPQWNRTTDTITAVATYYLRDLTRQEIRRQRVWAVPFVGVCLVVGVICFWIEVTSPKQTHRAINFVAIASFVWAWLAIKGIFTRNRWLKERHLFEIRVSPEGVFRSSPNLPDLFLPRNEIVGFSELRRGWLKIETSRRKYFIAIPPYLDDLSTFREELSSYGIPLIDAPKESWAKTILFIGGFVLGGALGGFAQNRVLATCGWVLLAAMFVWSFFEIRGNPNVSRRFMGPLSIGLVLLFVAGAIIWIWHR